MRSTGRLGQRHFNVAKQRAMIAGHGQHVLVTPTVTCPCVTLEGHFNPNDSACRGTGRLPIVPLAFSTTLALILEDSKRTYHEPGTWTDGSILCLTPPEVRLAERDLVQLTDIRDVFNDELLVRGRRDTVRFQAGVQLTIVADQERLYVDGTDYTLTPPATVTWLPGGVSPALDAPYSVRYSAFPEYLVFNDSPRLRVEGHVTQSQEVRLLRLDCLQRG